MKSRIIGMALLAAVFHAQTLWAQVDRGEQGTPQDHLALSQDVTDTVGLPRLAPVSGVELDRRTHDLSSRLRCPVCQGHAVDDSPSETARNIKRQVRAMIAAGFDEEQIFRYFEASYGEFVRLIPKAQGFNLLVWALPVLGVLLGFVVVWQVIRRQVRRNET